MALRTLPVTLSIPPRLMLGASVTPMLIGSRELAMRPETFSNQPEKEAATSLPVVLPPTGVEGAGVAVGSVGPVRVQVGR